MLYRRYIIHGGAKCMIRFACFIVAWCWGALRVFPGGNQVDGLPPAPSNSQSSHCFLLEASARRVIMVAWVIAGPSEAKLFVARDPFNDDVLRIVLSEFDKI